MFLLICTNLRNTNSLASLLSVSFEIAGHESKNVPLLIALIDMQGMMNQRPREDYEENIQLGITVHLPGIPQGLVRRGPRAQQWW